MTAQRHRPICRYCQKRRITVGTTGFCERCHADLAYKGTWVRRGLLKMPVKAVAR